MGVIVKDMKMPTGCNSCQWEVQRIPGLSYFCSRNGEFLCKEENRQYLDNHRHNHCPLLDIENDDNIIDRKALIKSMEEELSAFVADTEYAKGLVAGYRASIEKINIVCGKSNYKGLI